jgi:hypothetical protein
MSSYLHRDAHCCKQPAVAFLAASVFSVRDLPNTITSNFAFSEFVMKTIARLPAARRLPLREGGVTESGAGAGDA